MRATETYNKLVPEPTPHSAPYWEGLNARKLLLQKCRSCGRIRHYPQPMCPGCHSMEVEWIEASGRGAVHSWTITHHPFHAGFLDDFPCRAQALTAVVRQQRLGCQTSQDESKVPCE